MDKFISLLSWGDTGWSDELVGGAQITLIISAGAFITGLLIGGFVAWVKLRGPRYAVVLANSYSTICRAVPELLLIIVLFYSGQVALNNLLDSLGFSILNISPMAAAIVVLGIVQGAYASEILRGAVLAIPRGQVEAARAYGFHGIGLFRRVTLPAIIPYALAGLANLWMVIIKDSSLISVVGYSELIFNARQAAGGTKFYFSFYLLAGAMYYVISTVSAGGIRLIEARVRRWMPRLS